MTNPSWMIASSVLVQTISSVQAAKPYLPVADPALRQVSSCMSSLVRSSQGAIYVCTRVRHGESEYDSASLAIENGTAFSAEIRQYHQPVRPRGNDRRLITQRLEI